jgi:hypothetical protein
MFAAVPALARRMAGRPAAPSGSGRLIPLVLLAIGLFEVPLTFTGIDFRFIPGDLIDSRFNNYVLEHGYRWLTRRPHGSFWSPPFCYPARNMAAGSDAHVGTLPLYAAFRVAGAEPERAFQLWGLALFVLTFFAAYLSARWLGLSRPAAGIAAFVFAFGPPVIGQMNHAQLYPRFFIPPAFAAGWYALGRPSWRLFGATAICVAGQFYCGIYLGLFLVGLLATFLTAAAIIGRRRVPWRAVLAPAWGEAIARVAAITVPVVGLAWLGVPYLRAAGELDPLEREVIRIAPDLRAWLRPPDVSATWAWLRPLAGRNDWYEAEKLLFPGAASVAGLGTGLLALGLSMRRGSETRTLAAAAAVAVAIVPILFVEIDGRSLYREALQFPGVEKLRATGRVAVVLLAPLGLLAGLAADALCRRLPRRPAVLALGLLLALPAVDAISFPSADAVWLKRRFPLAEGESRRTVWAAAIRAHPQATLVYVFQDPTAPALDRWARDVDVMWGALDVGVPTANGYTGYWPRGWYEFDDYCGLFHWVRTRGTLTPELLAGACLFGRPPGADDRVQERELRAQCPWSQLPSGTTR